MTMTLSERIKKQRENIGISQRGLASRMGISHTAISLWEKGDVSNISVVNFLTLARALGVSMHWLLTGKELTEEPPLVPMQELPLIEWNEIGSWKDHMEYEKGSKSIAFPGDFSSSCFVTKVHGRSMMPRFIEGQFIKVCTSAKPKK